MSKKGRKKERKAATYEVQCLRELGPCVGKLELADVFKVVRDELLRGLVQRRRSQCRLGRDRQRRRDDIRGEVRARVRRYVGHRVYVGAIQIRRS